MKIQALSLLASAAATTAATQLPHEISATSDLGRSILSQSRRLDGNEDDDEDAYAWIAGYSLKFQGCRYHASFNSDADEDGDVKVQTNKLAHFRLCPADSCDGWRGGGCTSGYGDYVVDLATFAKTFVEGQKRAAEYQCQMYMYESCDCNDNDDKDDGFNEEYCEYDCYNDAGMAECIDRNPYNDDEGSDDRGFEAERYAECEEYELPEEDDDANANRRRRLDGEEEEEEVQYFIGPYCSADGGSVYLGLYTDDTCTNFADSNSGKTLYKELSGGEDLPYSSASLITSDCVTCVEQKNPNSSNDEDNDDANADDAEEAVEVSDQCGELYESAGKCESAINYARSGMTSLPNTNACSYINGIQFTKTNGVIEMKASKTAGFFIFLFAAAFIGLAGVVFKLHRDIQAARKMPLLEKEDSQEDHALS